MKSSQKNHKKPESLVAADQLKRPSSNDPLTPSIEETLRKSRELLAQCRERSRERREKMELERLSKEFDLPLSGDVIQLAGENKEEEPQPPWIAHLEKEMNENRDEEEKEALAYVKEKFKAELNQLKTQPNSKAKTQKLNAMRALAVLFNFTEEMDFKDAKNKSENLFKENAEKLAIADED